MAARIPGAERRERILSTSMRLFAARGFAATKTKDVARAAGVSEAMVFKHFPDKESLYRALIERKIAEAEEVLPLADLEKSGEALDVFLARIAGEMLRKCEEDASFLRLFLLSALEDHPLAAEFDAARADRMRTVVAAHLRRETRAGRVRSVDPAFAARAFLGLVAWFALARTIFREPGSRRIPREKLVRETVALFLDGVRTR